MTGSSQKLSLDDLKQNAKAMRLEFAAAGKTISHAQALECLAQQKGYRNWNTLRAALPVCGEMGQAPSFHLVAGQRVRGVYLGQNFQADVLTVEEGSAPESQRVTLHFDAPVDVVSFDSFSCYRQRVSCTLGKEGKTVEKTSNGVPHLSLNR